MGGTVQIIPVRGVGEVRSGDDLLELLLGALERQGTPLADGDVLVVTQKIVSKAEGRLASLDDVEPSPFARIAAAQGNKDPAYYEIVLRESRRVVRMDRGVLITETHHGLICANAGVDESNVAGGRVVTLLPADPDASAAALRAAVRERAGVSVAVLISDSFGRAWREGQVNVAIGAAGIAPIADYAGIADPYGMTMRASQLAVADELASAAELVMGKIDQVPAAIVRGYPYAPSELDAQALIRPPERDMFR